MSMFPEITKNKKKITLGTEQMKKQCQQILKDLEYRYKNIYKKIPTELLSDINKIIKLKEIPDFYFQYFLHFLQKSSTQTFNQIVKQQIQNLMKGQSFYHKITLLIKARVQILMRLNNQLQITQGFLDMNSGKNIPNSLKIIINQMLKQCNTLQDIKNVQNKSIQNLSQILNQIRNNAKNIIDEYFAWKNYLFSFDGSNLPSIKKLKVIFPQNHIHCIFIILYDTQYLQKTFLKKQLNFEQKCDPFLEHISKNKRDSNFQRVLFNKLESCQKYQGYLQKVEKEIPGKQQQKQKQKQKQKEQKNYRQLKSQKKTKRNNNGSNQKKQIQKDITKNMSVSLENIKKQKKTISIERTNQIYLAKKNKKNKKVQQFQNNSNDNKKLFQILQSQVQDKQRPQTVKKFDNNNQSNLFQVQQKKNRASSVLSIKNQVQHIRKQVSLPYTVKSPKKKKVKQQEQRLSLQELKALNRNLQNQLKKVNQQKRNIEKMLKSENSQVINQFSKINIKNQVIEEEKQSFKNLKTQNKNLQNQLKKINQQKLKIEKTLQQKKKELIKQNVQLQAKLKNYEQQSSISVSRLTSLNKNLQDQLKKVIQQKQKIEKMIQKNEKKKQPKGYQANTQTTIQNLKSINKNLQASMKKVNIQKQKIQKILEKNQKKISKQNEKLQIKLHQYQQQINNLRKNRDLRRQQKSPTRANKNSVSQIKNSKISLIYQFNQQQKMDPQKNLLETQIIKEKQQRKNLQKQIFQLNKQKIKVQKLLEQTQGKVSKQKNIYQRKIQKYQEIIQKLKKQANEKKVKDQEAKIKRISNTKNLRMYTTTPIDKEQKNQQFRKDLSMNLFRMNKQKIKNHSLSKKPQTIREQDQISFKQSKVFKNGKNIEIIKTSKTIQILFDSKIKKSNKKSIINMVDNERNSNIKLKQLKEQKLAQIIKQKKLLQKKLELSIVNQNVEAKSLERKVQLSENQIQKYKQLVNKQRIKKQQMEEQIRKVRKNIKQQYELKMSKERAKFEKEKQELKRKIQTQKEQKLLKQKYLAQQLKFLKQMEKNQNDLIQLLEQQKAQKKKKQKQLALQIAKRQQLLEMIEIQEIKKGIQQEIRQQFANDNSTQQVEQVNDQKSLIQQQIQVIKQQGDQQLKQIQKQNSKLKELIVRIKQEEQKLIQAIKTNIQQDNNNFEQYSETKNQNNIQQQKSQQDKISVIEEKNEQLDKQVLMEQLKAKTSRLLIDQKKRSEKYKQIASSPEYKYKQKIENLVQYYLNNPHKYPQNHSVSYSKKQKSQVVEQILGKSKLVTQFQKELYSAQKMKGLVPTVSDDPILSHLLNLREAYEEEQVESLRRQLFPPINQGELFNQKQLSVESDQTPPPETINDHIKAHNKKLKEKKERELKQKNFMAINKMRVVLLQQTRKQKQRLMIQQQSKKKVKRKQLYINKKIDDKLEEQIKQQKKNQEQTVDMNKKVDQEGYQSSRSKKSKNSKAKSIKSQSQAKKKDNNQLLKQQQGQEQQKNQFINNEMIQKIDSIEKKTNKTKKDKIQSIKQQNQNQQSLQYQNQFIEIPDTQVQERQRIKIQKKQLEQDIISYQQSIRSYISGEQQFTVYQQFVNEIQLATYIRQTLQLCSQQIQSLNNNTDLQKVIQGYPSLAILIAKDKKYDIEIGIGIFHKQYESGHDQYVCDYLLAHNMRNFLNLTFNLSRHIFQTDPYTNKVQYLFNLSEIQDKQSLRNFVDFQNKCKRLGEVYVKMNSLMVRRYVMKRNLFQQIQNTFQNQGKGVKFDARIQIHDKLMKQKGKGFVNKKNVAHGSSNTLLAYYLKKNPQKLKYFRQNVQNDLKYRQLLVTALMLEKKETQIKSLNQRNLTYQQKYQLLDELSQKFIVNQAQSQVSQTTFILQQALKGAKRCTFNIQDQNINYLIIKPTEAIVKIQTSNSSQTGIFLNIIQKYKLLIIQAQQFLRMGQANPDMTVFFYVKHFIKNIVQVQKQNYGKIFLPQISENDWTYLSEISKKLNQNIFLKEQVKIGWNTKIPNSVVFNPHHKDLVIRKPFIISLLSSNIQRIVQGSPILAKLIL